MQVWNVLHAARGKYSMQNIARKLPSKHHCTILSSCIFTTKAYINNQKKNLLNSNTSSTCPHNRVNFSPLTAEIGSWVWGTPASFNRFRILAALLHGTLVKERKSIYIAPFCTKVHTKHQWASAKLCGIEQSASTIFGRAAITLGIGPHSSRYWNQSA